VAQRSPTTPRSRSLTPPRARPSCNDSHSGNGEDGAAWIKRTASAAMLGLASLGVVSDWDWLRHTCAAPVRVGAAEFEIAAMHIKTCQI
jgi:hypothetical protein